MLSRMLSSQTHTRQHRQERTSNANALLSASSYLEAHHASRRVQLRLSHAPWPGGEARIGRIVQI